MYPHSRLFTTGVLVIACAVASASTISVTVNRLSDGVSLGEITLKDSAYGMLIQPHLNGVSPGAHGVHVHVNPSCAKGGKAAGGHFDPTKTGQHRGPYSDKGHAGDLPLLIADAQGKVSTPVLAPRLRVADIIGRSIIVHAGGDNYGDKAQPLGGGGARLACAVVSLEQPVRP